MKTPAVTFRDPSLQARARALAEDLQLPLLSDTAPIEDGRWLLICGPDGLAIQQQGRGAAGPVRVDFVGGKLGFRRQRQQATPDLVKAIGLRPGVRPSVWDLTAGLGQDAFVLACHGCEITLVERNPLVQVLLRDGIERARLAAVEDASLADVMARMRLVCGDSGQMLSGLDEASAPDVFYIDTMFPERSKSAKVKKEMQLFQVLVGKDADADDLLDLALRKARHRVVVKRPRHAPVLGAGKPGLEFVGKSVRFDVYALRKLEAG